MHRFIVLTVGAVLLSASIAGQSPQKWTPPHTPDGQPDLQGVWNFSTITPLERPIELGNKQFYTAKEAADYERTFLQRNDRDRRDGSAETDLSRENNAVWWDLGHVVSTLRTSLVIDPLDGGIPPWTAEAKKRAAERSEQRRLHAYDGPEDRPLAERCLVAGTAGPPIVPGGYNNNISIVQGSGYVAILNEMNHDARIIPLDGRPHLPKSVHLWMGDSRGRWEGNTLVVDTTNFTDKTNFRGADENMRLIERFTRSADQTLMYRFTVDDPTAFTKSWTAELPMRKIPGPIFDYACHEGNYSLMNALAGARAEEK